MQSEEDSVVRLACTAVCQVFVHLIQHSHGWLLHREWVKVQSLLDSKADDVMSQFCDWMRGNYACCKERLLCLLHSDCSAVQVSKLKYVNIIHVYT